MKVIKDELDMIAHPDYDNFEKSQFIVGLAAGDVVEILINGIRVKEYVAKYINCHIDMSIQDKSIKRPELTDLQIQIAQRDNLDFLIQKGLAEQ